MTETPYRRDNLASLIFNMEDNVRNLVRWGQAVRSTGYSNVSIDAGSLYVIGLALIEAAEKVESDWVRCFDLSRSLKGGA